MYCPLFYESTNMLQWIILVTFAAASSQAQDPPEYTKTLYGQRQYTQVITDSRDRAVLFDTKEQCMGIARKVSDTMMQDKQIVVVDVKCVHPN